MPRSFVSPLEGEMGHWRGLKGCGDAVEKVWAWRQVEGGAGNVILALGREKSFGTEEESRARAAGEEGRRSVGAQDKRYGGGEGMVRCWGEVTEGTNGATEGWEGAGA